jgi:hypothetical protein
MKNSLVAVSVVGGGDADGHRLAHRAQGGRLRRRRCRLAHDAEARHLGPLVRRRRVQTQKSFFFVKINIFFKINFFSLFFFKIIFFFKIKK